MSHAGGGTAFFDGGRRTPERGAGMAFRRPGWKEAAIFPLLVFLGAVVWFATSPGMTSMLFGVNLCLWSPDLPFVSPTHIVLGAAALWSGFVFPRGFYLWGVALALHSPFAQGLTVYLMEREGVELAGGTEGLVGFAAIVAVLILFGMFCYTILSAGGVGLRLLVGRFASR